MPAARWITRPYSVAEADALAAELGLSPVTAAVLARRGHATPAEARRFLAADEAHDPLAFAGIDAVCELILGHARRGARIVVHGDYDVDGVCSTAILIRALRALGADPAWHLPSRADGYGLTDATVERLAARGTDLLITVDCAITAADEVAGARAGGMDVVVTDHHRPADRLPDCPIVHPVLSGYPFGELCAAGVAHKLAEALFRAAGADPEPLREDLDLVALATVADLVPLRGENRRLVRAGLEALSRTRKPGLRALMRVAQVEPGGVTEHALGFRLAPRINAAGRVQDAEPALELLLTEDGDRAAAVADELDLLNRERQDTETRILFAAEAARTEQAGEAAYVLSGEGWHPGVIGIVASRMVERYHRPCVLIALDGDSGRGSGRSISAYDLHAGLAACSGYLLGFGGHRAAAGLELAAPEVDAFRAAFAAHAAAALTPADLVPVERVDAVVPGDALGTELAEELERLAPFGMGNPAPTLLVPGARVSDVRSMGEDGQHARFTLSGGGSRARTVAFRTTADSLPGSADDRYDAAVRLELNEWNGAVEPRLVLRALCPTEPGSCAVLAPAEPFWTTVERELRGDAAAPPPSPPRSREGARRLRDRRGAGLAGVAGDLLSSGEGVLVVCADADRRREGIEGLVAGLAGRALDGECPELGLVEWDALAGDPGLAAEFEHVLALDPPAGAGHDALLHALPPGPSGAGFAHRAWGAPEGEFALAVAAARLDLRTDIASVYRALRDRAPGAGAELEAVLRGDGPRPRPAAVCGRVLRVLAELELIELDAGSPGPECRLLEPRRTELERSPAFRAYGVRLAEARAFLERDRRVPAAAPAAVTAA